MAQPSLPHPHRHSTYWHICIKAVVSLVLLFVCCGPTAISITPGLTGNFAPARAFSLSEQSIKENVPHILAAMGDTIASDLLADAWKTASQRSTANITSSTEPHPDNLFTMFRLLRSRVINAIHLVPESAEALHAITTLPHLPMLALLHFPGTDVQSLNKIDLQSNDFSHLSGRIDRVQIHVVQEIRIEGNTYTIVTNDGIECKTLGTDRLNGLVFSAKTADGASEYCQIVGHFVLTDLPAFEIENQLNEWYRTMPYTHGQPKAQEL